MSNDAVFNADAPDIAALSVEDFRLSVQRESPVTDTDLAELIEADGRAVLRRGLRVSLSRYLQAVPDLVSRANPLDAALEVVLRSLSGSARITDDAVQALTREYPTLERAIREAATLNAALWSTTGLRNRVVPPPVKLLPHEFGPILESGHRRYLLQGILGQGSFGQVYKALDRQLSDDDHAAVVAIKILMPGDLSLISRQRLFDEATKARRVAHPNVVLVLDRGTSDAGEDFIVYEHVNGGDLSERAWEWPLPARAAAALLARIARGVHAAHNAGLIHCDLKPSNIMLTHDGVPKVADFGIAVRVDEHGDAEPLMCASADGPIGNIAFISPEQFRREDGGLSVKSDVYALGGMLYQALTGCLPNGTTREEIAANHDAMTGRRTAPSVRDRWRAVDDDLDAICRRALAPRARERYDSAASLADDLERWLRIEPLEWRRPSPLRRLSMWARRRPTVASAAAAILAIAVGGAAVAGHFAALAQQRSREVEAARADARAKQREKELREDLASRVTGALSRFAGVERERFVTDIMMQIWVLEHIYGPAVLDTPKRVSELWARRIDTAREMIANRIQRGQGDSLETRLWQSMLGFWLASQGQHAEAMDVLDRAIDAWSAQQPRDEVWLSDLRAMRACAEVSRWMSVPSDSADVRSDAIQTLDDALTAHAVRLDAERPRSPLHYLVVRRLIDLTSSHLLDDPTRHAELAQRYRDLLDGSHQQATGVSRDVQQTSHAIQAPTTQTTGSDE